MYFSSIGTLNGAFDISRNTNFATKQADLFTKVQISEISPALISLALSSPD